MRMDVTAKAKRVVRAYAGLRPGDRIAVICTGRKSGYALLSFMHSLLAGRGDIALFCVICTNDQSLQAAAFRLCGELGIECIPIAVREKEMFLTFYGIQDSQVRKQLDHAAREHGITKFILDQTLDDTALFVLTRLLEGGAPGNENETVWRFPVITPFVHIPAREADLYADMSHPDIRAIPSDEDRHESSGQGFEEDVKILLDDYCSRHPSTKFALVNLGEALRHPGLALNVPEDSSNSETQYRREP